MSIINIGNDGAKTPTPDPDEGKVVEYMPTAHQYKIGYLPESELHRINTEQLLLELGVLGADGWLLVSLFKTPGDDNLYTAVFCRTGIKVPKQEKKSKLHVPGGPRGLV